MFLRLFIFGQIFVIVVNRVKVSCGVPTTMREYRSETGFTEKRDGTRGKKVVMFKFFYLFIWSFVLYMDWRPDKNTKEIKETGVSGLSGISVGVQFPGRGKL